MPKKTTPEKPPTQRELSIAGKVLGNSNTTKSTKTLAGRVLSEGAASKKGKGH
jgi:hypothetical protein